MNEFNVFSAVMCSGSTVREGISYARRCREASQEVRPQCPKFGYKEVRAIFFIAVEWSGTDGSEILKR